MEKTLRQRSVCIVDAKPSPPKQPGRKNRDQGQQLASVAGVLVHMINHCNIRALCLVTGWVGDFSKAL